MSRAPATLDVLKAQIQHEFGLVPVMAVECEFYLENSPREAVQSALDTQLVQALLAKMVDRARIAHLGLNHLEAESGLNQFEFSLLMTDDITLLASSFSTLKTLISELATRHHLMANFAAKPYQNQPGSGLHIHLHLEDKNGKNAFYKDDAHMSEALQNALSGLLETMSDNMPIFAPSKQSEARFLANDHHAPHAVCWGANNRSAALRLPIKPHDNKHIEHRVAGADADISAVLQAVLAGVLHGFRTPSALMPQLFGHASDPQYALTPLLHHPETSKGSQASDTPDTLPA